MSEILVKQEVICDAVIRTRKFTGKLESLEKNCLWMFIFKELYTPAGSWNAKHANSGWLLSEESARRIKIINGPYSVVYLNMWQDKFMEEQRAKQKGSRKLPQQAAAGE